MRRRSHFGFAIGAAALFALLVGGATSRATRALATPSWTTVAQANFDGEKDGAGDGKNLPTTVGTLTATTSTQLDDGLLHEFGPIARIENERVLLADVGTDADSPFGVVLTPDSVVDQGAYFLLIVEPLSPTGHFNFSAVHSVDADVDCVVPGSAGDGTVVEMLMIDSDNGAVMVNGTPLYTTFEPGGRYRIEGLLTDADDTDDYYEVLVTNLDTGVAEYAAGWLPFELAPIDALTVNKLAGEPGAMALDNFLMLAPAR